ncbi:putative phosphoserine transaminase, partial [Ancylostoma ceylanicum]
MEEARDLGGATLGFTIAALNMTRGGKAGYINTGTWASGAIKEAKAVGIDVQILASSEDKNFSYIPKNVDVPSDLDFLHYTSNNTIYGTQFQEQLKEINVADFDLIYAGAQKNLGPAGATLYIVKEEILGKFKTPFMPTYLNLAKQHEKESMLNTPPVFSVYVAMLNLRDLIATGGVKAAEKRNNEKAGVAVEDRSKMNVSFVLKDDYASLEESFNKAWNDAGIVGLKGHRSTAIGKQLLEEAGFIVVTDKVDQTDLIDTINRENYEIVLVRSATTIRKE